MHPISYIAVKNIGSARQAGFTRRTVVKTVIKSLFFHIAKFLSEIKQPIIKRELIKKQYGGCA